MVRGCKAGEKDTCGYRKTHGLLEFHGHRNWNSSSTLGTTLTMMVAVAKVC